MFPVVGQHFNPVAELFSGGRLNEQVIGAAVGYFANKRFGRLPRGHNDRHERIDADPIVTNVAYDVANYAICELIVGDHEVRRTRFERLQDVIDRFCVPDIAKFQIAQGLPKTAAVLALR